MAKYITGYMVVTRGVFPDQGPVKYGEHLEAFNKDVMFYIKQGWALLGGVSVTSVLYPAPGDHKYKNPFAYGDIISQKHFHY